MTVDTVGVTAFDLGISSIPGLGFAGGPPAETCIAGAQPLGMDVVLHNGQTAFAITDTIWATTTMRLTPLLSLRNFYRNSVVDQLERTQEPGRRRL